MRGDVSGLTFLSVKYYEVDITHGHFIVSKHFRLVLENDTHVDVGTRAKIVENTRSNGSGDEFDSFLTL